MLAYTYRFLVSLVLTIDVEVFVLLLLVRKAFNVSEKDISSPRLIFAGCFASFSTLPYVWFVFPVVFYSSYSFAILLGEIFALFLEAAFYQLTLEVGLRKSLILSFVANIASFSIEFLLVRL